MEHTNIIEESESSMNPYFAAVYRWMAVALSISAGVGWYLSQLPNFAEMLAKNSGLFFGLVIVQLVAVVALAGWVHRMSTAMAAVIFLGYSALTGVTFASVFLLYTTASIVQTFLVSAGMFGAISLYGYVTKRDISGWGSFLFMSLIGIIIASIVNIFMQSHMITWVTTVAGVIIFSGLIAYDTQKLKTIARMPMGEETLNKMAIHGALTLYLDFINLFLHLLRLFGDRR